MLKGDISLKTIFCLYILFGAIFPGTHNDRMDTRFICAFSYLCTLSERSTVYVIYSRSERQCDNTENRPHFQQAFPNEKFISLSQHELHFRTGRTELFQLIHPEASLLPGIWPQNALASVFGTMNHKTVLLSGSC